MNETAGLQNQSAEPAARYWLFSAPVDLAVFLGSAVIALGAVWLGHVLHVPADDTPEWTWVSAILLVDVAHVYATGFRVYFGRVELSRRPWLYSLTPLIAFVIGLALYTEGERLFWRVLAYVAVFHFVRQQYGWVALYRAKTGETGRLGAIIDSAAIYLATIYPLVYWHANLPRQFAWFQPGDFFRIPPVVVTLLAPVYVVALVAYAVRAIYRAAVLRQFNPGKDIVLITTAVCWYVGIVADNSDYAFTVTNVIIHGVPYFALVYFARFRRPGDDLSAGAQVPRFAMFLGLLWVLAYVEEMFWSRGVRYDREWLFGLWQLPAGFRSILAPLLAVPQLTHYILDGFIWRRRRNPDMRQMLEATPPADRV